MLDGLDLDALTVYLAPFSRAPYGAAPESAASPHTGTTSRPGSALRAELIQGGKSNLTYRLTDGSHNWVLRRPPLGHVLQRGGSQATQPGPAIVQLDQPRLQPLIGLLIPPRIRFANDPRELIAGTLLPVVHLEVTAQRLG